MDGAEGDATSTSISIGRSVVSSLASGLGEAAGGGESPTIKQLGIAAVKSVEAGITAESASGEATAGAFGKAVVKAIEAGVTTEAAFGENTIAASGKGMAHALENGFVTEAALGEAAVGASAKALAHSVESGFTTELGMPDGGGVSSVFSDFGKQIVTSVATGVADLAATAGDAVSDGLVTLTKTVVPKAAAAGKAIGDALGGAVVTSVTAAAATVSATLAQLLDAGSKIGQWTGSAALSPVTPTSNNNAPLQPGAIAPVVGGSTVPTVAAGAGGAGGSTGGGTLLTAAQLRALSNTGAIPPAATSPYTTGSGYNAGSGGSSAAAPSNASLNTLINNYLNASNNPYLSSQLPGSILALQQAQTAGATLPQSILSLLGQSVTPTTPMPNLTGEDKAPYTSGSFGTTTPLGAPQPVTIQVQMDSQTVSTVVLKDLQQSTLFRATLVPTT